MIVQEIVYNDEEEILIPKNIHSPICPCCGADSGCLELLAQLFDTWDSETENPCREIQNDLRAWADKIKNWVNDGQ